MVKRCASCGLINPPTAFQCDCGFVFAQGDAQEENQIARSQAARGVWLGALVAMSGLAVALVSPIVSLGLTVGGATMFATSYRKWQRVRAWSPPALPKARALSTNRPDDAT